VILYGLVVAVLLAAAPQSPGTEQEEGRHVAATIAPAESTLVGVIDKFEETARRLILRTKDAQIPFVLAPDVSVRLGSRTLPVDALAAHHGRKAKVRYTQADGRRTAHWVVISSEPPRGAS
jgi:hypothetical protein